MDNGIINSDNVKQVIGVRLQAARDKRHLTRPEFCNLLQESRMRMENSEDTRPLQTDTYKQWELGKNKIDIEWIPAIREVLQCDIDYLFGYIPFETQAETNIHAVTGLSEGAIKNLEQAKKESGQVIAFLNELLTHLDCLDNIAKRYFMYRAIKELDSKIKKCSTKIDGKKIDLKMEFDESSSVEIPILQAFEYSKFELLRTFTNYIDR